MRRLPEEVFLDTWFAVALLNPKDQYHALARACASDFMASRRIVTTVGVLFEIGNHSRIDRAKRADFLRVLLAKPSVEVVGVNREELSEAVGEFARVEDKGWSLVDCLSFLVMRRVGLVYALTGDEHFGQAGFATLETTSSSRG